MTAAAMTPLEAIHTTLSASTQTTDAALSAIHLAYARARLGELRRDVDHAEALVVAREAELVRASKVQP